MDNLFKVSVIMPVYNVENYLKETLNSVINQTLKDIEIICVDDGSTDSSVDIIKKFQKNDSRIQLIFQKNQYAGVARNNGLGIAKGKYVVFWDSDDLFDKHALELMYRQCEKDQADLCVCGANRYDTNTHSVIKTNTYLRREWLPKKIPFSKLTHPKYIFNFSTNVPWNKMWNREFILKNNLEFQDIKQANDTYFSMLSYFLAERITIVDKPLISYRINNSKSLTGKASETVFCSYQAYCEVYNFLKGQSLFKGEVIKSFHNRLINGMLYSLKTQTHYESFVKIYNQISKNLLVDFDIPNDLSKDYFYTSKDYNDFLSVLNDGPEQFLLLQYYQTNTNIYTRGSKIIYKLYYSLYYSCFWKVLSFIKK